MLVSYYQFSSIDIYKNTQFYATLNPDITIYSRRKDTSFRILMHIAQENFSNNSKYAIYVVPPQQTNTCLHILLAPLLLNDVELQNVVWFTTSISTDEFKLKGSAV